MRTSLIAIEMRLTRRPMRGFDSGRRVLAGEWRARASFVVARAS